MVLYPNKLPESERVCFGICTVENQLIINVDFYATGIKVEYII